MIKIVKIKAYIAVSFALFLGVLRVFAEPSWWKARGVVPIDSDQGSSVSISGNYVPINLGQLKFFAKQAAAEMNAKLVNGAGDPINVMISSFSVYDANNPYANYSPVNIGQLKSVASLFYDRLAEVPSQVEFPAGMNIYGTYPWIQAGNSIGAGLSKNYSPANIGQVKFLFGWSITSQQVYVVEDVDDDGINDPWEMFYFGDLTVANAYSCYNGDAITDKSKFLGMVNPTQSNEIYLEVTSYLED